MEASKVFPVSIFLSVSCGLGGLFLLWQSSQGTAATTLGSESLTGFMHSRGERDLSMWDCGKTLEEDGKSSTFKV